MSEEILQQQIDALKVELEKLNQSSQLQDHRHNGFDMSMVRFKDLDSIFFMQATIDPANLVDGAGVTAQITNVHGATLGDFVLVAAPYDLQDITVTAYVQAKGVVEIRIQNESGATVNLASGVWRIAVIRKVV